MATGRTHPALAALILTGKQTRVKPSLSLPVGSHGLAPGPRLPPLNSTPDSGLYAALDPEKPLKFNTEKNEFGQPAAAQLESLKVLQT